MASLRKFKPLTRSESKKGRKLTPALDRTRRSKNKSSACIQLTFDSPPKSNKLIPEIKITGCNADQVNDIILAVSPILNPRSPPLPSSPYMPPKTIPLSPVPSSPLPPSSHSTPIDETPEGPSSPAGPTGNSIRLDDSFETLMKSLYDEDIKENELMVECVADSERVKHVLDYYQNLSMQSELDYEYDCDVSNSFSALHKHTENTNSSSLHTPPARTPSSRPPCNKNRGRKVGAAFSNTKKSQASSKDKSIIRMSPGDLPGVCRAPTFVIVGKETENQGGVIEECLVSERADTGDVANAVSFDECVSTSTQGVNETSVTAAPESVENDLLIPGDAECLKDCTNANENESKQPAHDKCSKPIRIETEDDFVPKRTKTAPAKIRASTRRRHTTTTLSHNQHISPVNGPNQYRKSECANDITRKTTNRRPTRSDTSKCATEDRVYAPSIESLNERAREDHMLEAETLANSTIHAPVRTVVISEDSPLPSTDTTSTQLTDNISPVSERIVTMGKLTDRPAPKSLISSEFETKLEREAKLEKEKTEKLEREKIPNLPHWRVILKEIKNAQNSLFKCSKVVAFEKLKQFFGEGLRVISKWSDAKKTKKVTIQASSEEQYNMLLDAKHITKSDNFHLHTSIDEIRIWGCTRIPFDKDFPTTIEVEDARDREHNTISDHDGKFEHRLNMKSDKKWVESKKGVFTFGCERLPFEIKIRGTSNWVEVVPYVFPARHCQRCTSYSHSTQACEKFKIGDPICAFCSGPHAVKDCKVLNDPTKALCNHCKGNHPVWHPNCPKKNLERLANKHRAGTRMYRMKSLQVVSNKVTETCDIASETPVQIEVAPDLDTCVNETETVTLVPDLDSHVNESETMSPDLLKKTLVSMFALLDFIIGKTNLNAPVVQNILCKDLEIDTKYSGLYKDIRDKILLDQARG